MPVLDRQPPTATTLPPANPTLPPSLRNLPPRSVPEVAPTPLQQHYVMLSVIPLIAGAVAITALNLGSPPGSALVKACVLLGAPILLLTTGDAALRIWRSAWAWLPVNPGRGLFRFAWFGTAVLFMAVILGAAILVLGA